MFQIIFECITFILVKIYKCFLVKIITLKTFINNVFILNSENNVSNDNTTKIFEISRQNKSCRDTDMQYI